MLVSEESDGLGSFFRAFLDLESKFFWLKSLENALRSIQREFQSLKNASKPLRSQKRPNGKSPYPPCK